MEPMRAAKPKNNFLQKVKSIAKKNGAILDKIQIPEDGPDPHGLSIKSNVLWYSDAAHPNPKRPYPEIGYINVK